MQHLRTFIIIPILSPWLVIGVKVDRLSECRVHRDDQTYR